MNFPLNIGAENVGAHYTREHIICSKIRYVFSPNGESAARSLIRPSSLCWSPLQDFPSIHCGPHT